MVTVPAGTDTATSSTPSIRRKAFSIFTAQDAQAIPTTCSRSLSAVSDMFSAFGAGVEAGSRLSFQAQPLVERFAGLGKIDRLVSHAVIREETQVCDQVERRWIEIEILVHTGRPAQYDSTHEALSPGQVVPSHRGIGRD